MPVAPAAIRSCATAALLAIGSAAVEASAADNLVVNGSFNAQPNPLAFWSSAPDALAGWVSDGANGSQGSAQIRFLPTRPADASSRGAVFFTGLTQCVAVAGPGIYVLSGYGRVPATASPASFAGIRWTLRSNGPLCVGDVTQNGSVNIPRATAWTASVPSTIEIDSAIWTTGTTLEIQLQVGDSSTQTVEPLEAFIDEVALVELPFFADGFEQ